MRLRCSWPSFECAERRRAAPRRQASAGGSPADTSRQACRAQRPAPQARRRLPGRHTPAASAGAGAPARSPRREASAGGPPEASCCGHIPASLPRAAPRAAGPPEAPRPTHPGCFRGRGSALRPPAAASTFYLTSRARCSPVFARPLLALLTPPRAPLAAPVSPPAPRDLTRPPRPRSAPAPPPPRPRHAPERTAPGGPWRICCHVMARTRRTRWMRRAGARRTW